MNKARRKWLGDIIAQLTERKDDLESVRDEEQEAYDNLPESIQYAERGEAMSDTISDIDSAIGDLESIIDTLQDIIDR